MKSKNLKTHFDRNVFLTFLVLLCVGLILISFKINSKVDCTNADFKIISNSFTTEDLIEFNSIDGSGVEWKWNFGDKSETKYQSNVVHQFQKPGTYKISLQVNGQCEVEKEVVISEKKILISPELIPNIILPRNVRVGDEVVFSNDSDFAKTWQWSFGETLSIDGIKQEEKYTFTSPGEKTILLVVNGDRRHEAKQRITVLEKRESTRRPVRATPIYDPIEQVLDNSIPDALPDPDPVPEEDKKPEIKKIVVSSDDIKQKLVGYSNRSIDDRAIREYFCYSSIPVFNNSGERHTINQLFNAIRDKKIEVNNIKLVKNNKTGCIVSMTIDMKIKKGLFSKTF
ncbi:PKD domain-containing protein [Cellulophaga baltica]|uniref:PKD domain-containing protein n=1 Tax=Cellulophaga TaxID=104264 RepID=UPI001C07D946|nr:MULTISPECIES: PKD domain-containing protein [Cellulophaga]MBU2997474.1 PKD domain-containing protein [Cellulophaga baltica]MDO6768871.1 PKD domain-containing protein [Cellulophaga sp. 1_MG-2023]